MTNAKPDFPIEKNITLEHGTVVSLFLPGTYTLEWSDEGPYLDVGYKVDFVERGHMDEDDVEAVVKAHVDQIMMPIMFTDPAVIAHLRSTERPPQPDQSAANRGFKRR